MLLDDIRAHIADSVKQKDVNRSETLRFLLADIQKFAIAKYGADWETDLTDKDIDDVLRKQVKSHRESIDAFKQAGRQDLILKEEKQLVILIGYLPEEMSDEELYEVLQPILKTGENNFGLLMKSAMDKLKGKVDGGRVAKVLKSMLNT